MKRFYVFFKNLSVSWKFMFAYFSVLIVPFTFSGVYLYWKTSDSAISQAKLVMEQNLLQTRASILQKVNLIEKISQIITSYENIKLILDYEYEDETNRLVDYQFDVSPFIQNVCRQNNAINAIRIYTTNSVITEMVGSYYSIRKNDSIQWYYNMISKKPAKLGWSGSHDAIGNIMRDTPLYPDQVFSYTGAINSFIYKNGIGTLEIEVKENLLFDMLQDPVIRKWGKVFIADSQGYIVSTNIPLLYKTNVSDIGFNDYAVNKKVNRIEKVDNDNAIIIAIPIEEINCSIVGVFKVSNFISEVKDSIINIIFILVAFFILLGLIIYIITNALLSRVKKLVKAMKQVRDNNLAVSVPVKSTDEFGVLALTFNHMTGRIHDLVETVYKIQLMEREAELKAMEAQINPHFLYNTLATISWAARKANSPEIVTISNSLAKFYRLVLSKGRTLIYVKEELDMVRAYLEIQKIRFEEMFDVIYEIDEAVYKNKMVKNILQPIIENALNHGIEPKRKHGTIILKVWQSEDVMFFQVIDDGVGMSAGTLNEILAGRVEKSGGSGYAIKNIMERLTAFYGSRYTIDIFSKPGIGTQIIIAITTSEL